jgi:hypothetical protein
VIEVVGWRRDRWRSRCGTRRSPRRAARTGIVPNGTTSGASRSCSTVRLVIRAPDRRCGLRCRDTFSWSNQVWILECRGGPFPPGTTRSTTRRFCRAGNG